MSSHISLAPATDSPPSGGLGHFGLLWASALGAEVYALSHSPNKKNDALQLGAKEFICTKDKDWAKPWAYTFDFILNSADMTNEFNIRKSPFRSIVPLFISFWAPETFSVS